MECIFKGLIYVSIPGFFSALVQLFVSKSMEDNGVERLPADKFSNWLCQFKQTPFSP